MKDKTKEIEILKRSMHQHQRDNQREMHYLKQRLQMLARDANKMMKDHLEIKKDYKFCMKMMLQTAKCLQKLNAYHQSQQTLIHHNNGNRNGSSCQANSPSLNEFESESTSSTSLDSEAEDLYNIYIIRF